MNSQIDEFERIMLDYLKCEISSEDMQKLTILLKRENACREKYREIARSYALASSSWFARRKEQNFGVLVREKLCRVQIVLAGGQRGLSEVLAQKYR